MGLESRTKEVLKVGPNVYMQKEGLEITCHIRVWGVALEFRSLKSGFGVWVIKEGLESMLEMRLDVEISESGSKVLLYSQGLGLSLEQEV